MNATGGTLANSEISFSFGQNWKDFLDRSLDADQIRFAMDRTKYLLRLDSLEGLTFLDIGCGSGLFSYVARKLGAERIVSLDIDPKSVECARYMKKQAGNPSNWEILHGSILDQTFVRSLPESDIVYSWGVLHHTGNMWQAIRNAASLVRPGGRFAIAIYNKVESDTLRQWRGSYRWLRIKRAYNRGGAVRKRLMELAFASKDVASMMVRLKNPVKEIREYKRKRGMSWWHDHIDWLGGYPYEFATTGELFNFCHDEFGMQLERLYAARSIGCHELMFTLPAAKESIQARDSIQERNAGSSRPTAAA
ncbi:MAG TPA: class I SAM-dependent methyltransferase [Steroidobacteraceae bacterium]|nr:class I SAM-dependent methyltransferase [Steroidobacteraceae bacterium]